MKQFVNRHAKLTNRYQRDEVALVSVLEALQKLESETGSGDGAKVQM